MAAALWWRSWPSCDRRPTRREPTHGASGAGDRRGTRPQRSRLGRLRQIGEFAGPSRSVAPTSGGEQPRAGRLSPADHAGPSRDVRAAPRTERPQSPAFFSPRCGAGVAHRVRPNVWHKPTVTVVGRTAVFGIPAPGGPVSECHGRLAKTTGAESPSRPQVLHRG